MITELPSQTRHDMAPKAGKALAFQSRILLILTLTFQESYLFVSQKAPRQDPATGGCGRAGLGTGSTDRSRRPIAATRVRSRMCVGTSFWKASSEQVAIRARADSPDGSSQARTPGSAGWPTSPSARRSSTPACSAPRPRRWPPRATGKNRREQQATQASRLDWVSISGQCREACARGEERRMWNVSASSESFAEPMGSGGQERQPGTYGNRV